jgi:hypothetical protein
MQMVLAGVLAALMVFAPGADGGGRTRPAEASQVRPGVELVAGNPPIAKCYRRLCL